MIHWDREARRRKLSARLKALDATRLLAFSATTLEEATNLAAAPRHRVRTLVRAAAELARAPAAPSASVIAALVDRIGDAQPDEDDSPPRGCADLLDGAEALCSLIERPKPATASTIASFAYQAVLDRFIDRRASAGGEAELDRAERDTPKAMTFLDAQYTLLAVLESGASGRMRRAVAKSLAAKRGADSQGASPRRSTVRWSQDGVTANLALAATLRRIDALADVETTAVGLTLPRGDVITLLLAPERALLLHMDRPGEVGRLAVGAPGKERVWRFRLDNGQVDAYPNAKTLPRRSALALIRALLMAKRIPRSVTWKK